MENRILVLGTTGKTGKRVAEKLKKMTIPLRTGSRNGNPPFDWEKPGFGTFKIDKYGLLPDS